MRTDYSKPLGDIGPESLDRLSGTADKKYLQQMQISRDLQEAEPRQFCLLCQHPLKGSRFIHRGVDYVRCGQCSHVQSLALPLDGYPHHDDQVPFHAVYPPLEPAAYQDRIDRIYKPKLDWFLQVLADEGINNSELQSKKWVELGCGAGYFLSSLATEGFKNIAGFDMDAELVKRANAMTPDHVTAMQTADSLQDTVSSNPAGIYIAFFVLEHVADLYSFFQQLRKLPSKTIFYFSVPMFGMSCMLENAFNGFYARNLDNVVHTQVFTEKSVGYALDMAEFELVSQWVFGQDAEDFCRFIVSSLRDFYPDDLLEESGGALLKIQDKLQNLFDLNHLSDQRHIIAVKR